MGITSQIASAIIGAHANKPIVGRVLSCGRQSVFFTPTQAYELIRSHDLIPKISINECELDYDTQVGGENQAKSAGKFISDRSFFLMLGVEQVEFLDHSDYEGAETVIDLNFPIFQEMESIYDFIIDGGTLDNIFNPAQALMNLSKMLKPEGRLLTYNFYANFGATYTNLSHQWYLDYFALNNFLFSQTYFCFFDSYDGRMSVYQPNLNRRASREIIGNFPISEPSIGTLLITYAIKGNDSTWARQPSQECYRSETEWKEMDPNFHRFAAYKLTKPVLRSTAAMPIQIPANFQYIDEDGELITQATINTHNYKLRENIFQSMKYLDNAMGDKLWGIFETESIFFDLLNESPLARQIIAKNNVFLFDVRMLNDSVLVNNVNKTIYPGTAAFIADIPILILNTEPNIEAFWKRASRIFRHLHLYSACSFRKTNKKSSELEFIKLICGRTTERSPNDGEFTKLQNGGNLVDYFDSGIYISPSLEEGEYKGYSTPFTLSSDRRASSNDEQSPVLDKVSGWELQTQLLHRYMRRFKRLFGQITKP